MTDLDCASTPRISVIVEGYNEAADVGRVDQFSIEETLEALKKQDYCLDQVEVLLLGSSFQVAQWKEKFRDPGPFAALRFVEVDGAQYYELKNKGAEVAAGTILAFADADATPGPRWLSAIAEAIERGATLTVGPSLFRWKGGEGGATSFLQVVGSITWGFVVGYDAGGGRTAPAGMLGHNFAVRADTFQRYLFQDDLGRTLGSSLLFGRLRQDGVPMAFHAQQQAAHIYTARWWLLRYHPRVGYEIYRLMRTNMSFPNRWIARTGPLQPLLHMGLYVLMDGPRWIRYSTALRLPAWRRVALLPLVAALSVLARVAEMVGMCGAIVAPERMKRWAETS